MASHKLAVLVEGPEWGDAKFYGEWLLAAAKAESLWKEALEIKSSKRRWSEFPSDTCRFWDRRNHDAHGTQEPLDTALRHYWWATHLRQLRSTFAPTRKEANDYGQFEK